MTKDKPDTSRLLGETLTPLQRKALNFIRHCEEELNTQGIYIRASEMLEFVTTDREHTAITKAIDLPHFLQAMQTEMPRYFNLNNNNHPQVEAPWSSAQYELTIHDPMVVHPAPFHTDVNPAPFPFIHYNPEKVALGMNHAKQLSIRNALMQSSSLNKPYKTGQVFANFDSRPFAESDYGEERKITSALQVRLNPVNGEGINLFSRSPDLLEACTQSLLHMQDGAGLAFLPTAKSLGRIGINPATPSMLGITETKADEAPKAVNVSALKRVHTMEKEEEKKLKNPKIDKVDKDWKHRNNKTLLENRLAGADADPIVAMALTLAACMKPLRAYATGKLEKKFKAPQWHSDIPREHGALAKKFEDAKELKKLLGEEFYDAIQQEYGKGASR